MKLFSKAPDGGEESGVTGYWLCEIKQLFSIVVLHFAPGTREAFHSHAFRALTLWLRGCVDEHDLENGTRRWYAGQWKYTPRERFHRVAATGTGAWAISFRGPWRNTWQEYRDGRYVTLTHGRKEMT